MHRMFRYRLYPSRRQENHLQRHLDHCRDVYNTLLDYCRRNPTLLSQYTLSRLLPALKQERALGSQFARERNERARWRPCPRLCVA